MKLSKNILCKTLCVLSPLLFCASSYAATKIGITFPTQNQERWYKEGFYLDKLLRDEGFDVQLFFAGDSDSDLQLKQTKRMIDDNCKVIIISCIDGNAFTDVLKEAKSKNINVISYDHLLMNTDAAEYYATFDNYAVGLAHGNYIKNKLNLDNPNQKHYIELFTGSLDDNNTHFFWEGANEVLKPYIDAGLLVVKSKETSLEKCATQNWNPEIAAKRMAELISEQGYGPDGNKLDAILSPNDGIANGLILALKNAGYTAENMPVITGQDGELSAVKNIHHGVQSMTIYKDGKELSKAVLQMTKQLASGQDVTYNDDTTYNNGKIMQKTYMCDVTVVDKSNYKQVFVDSGLVKAEDIELPW